MSEEESDYIFEVVDKTGRKILLTRKQWKHITRRHPYMAAHLEETKETVENADKITDYVKIADANCNLEHPKV